MKVILNKLHIYKPLVAVVLTIILDLVMADSDKHPPVDKPYLLYALYVALFWFLGSMLVALKRPLYRERILLKADFYGLAFLALAFLNVATKKLCLIPAIFFPTPDRILGVLVEDFSYIIIDCLGSSAKLLFAGFLSGALVGLISGISIGFSKRASYWLNPVIKVLGPIPPTAWIPVVLVAFPSTWAGAVFIIALSVWFPTTLMTSSGILNVQNAFFEVSSTLGASRFYQIFKVGLPAAMPLIFMGLFSGACASFLTLMTAEMIGVKNGIGWYINWQRQMLSYANVYAGLIVIAVSFYTLITLFFKVRDHVLVWQKGMIKW